MKDLSALVLATCLIRQAFFGLPYLRHLRKAFKIILLSLTEHKKHVRKSHMYLAGLCTPLPVRLVRRLTQTMHLRTFDSNKISKANLRSIAG